MTAEIALMDGSEARVRVERVKAAVDQARADLVELWRRRAWIPLGYETWDALCDAEFAVRVALPRDERREVVGQLRGEGMSTRAIGSALGVSQPTVYRDLASTDSSESVEQPERVVSLDGRERPPTQPAKASPVERYPELSHYEDRPRMAERLADALDGYDADERAVRREALARTIAAEQRNGGPINYLEHDRDLEKALAAFQAASSAANLLRLSGGADLFARVLDRAEPVIRDAWLDTFRGLAELSSSVSNVINSTPTLRRVQ